ESGLDFDDIDDFAQALEVAGVNNALAAVQYALAGVPEPSTMTLAAIGVLGTLARRRNRLRARGNCKSNATMC
ncbi:MAG: PEP-CTERM sorting domain-containing protein, partial [Pirellulales bacterium]